MIIILDGIEDFSILKSGLPNWLFSNNTYTYYIYDNKKNKFINFLLFGSNITFNPQTRTASSQKNCVEYLDSDTGRKITTIQKIYHFHNSQFIYSPTENLCSIYYEYFYQADSTNNCDEESYFRSLSE
jgi:hypothetical protein